MMAGYSGKPLATKLGMKPGLKVYVDGAPSGFELGATNGAVMTTRMPKEADIVVTFCPDRARLEKRLSTLIDHTVVNGAIWVCWPKKSSGMRSDLDENVVRDIGLTAGLVDVKVAAIDDAWSGLKFVRRLKDR
jgi:hypothetical protein